MKPSLRKIPVNPLSSFSVRVDSGEKLLNNWHYHPELELLLIKNSNGTSIIGDKIENFNNCYLVLIGPNLPHTFIHENKKGNPKKKSKQAEAIVIHFDKVFLGDFFLNLPEMKEVRNLLVISKSGIKVTTSVQKMIIPIIEKMPKVTYLEKMLGLLEILKILAITKKYALIASKGFIYNASDENENRINKVHDFTIKNFDREITIEEVARLLNLTKESFCRFFKKITRKTYFQFLIEFRIGQACSMLVENNLTIKEIGYDCGYENLSNFYHQFKKVMGKSPMQYQKDYFKLASEYDKE
jgi:AraC-like DNA-binding protein